MRLCIIARVVGAVFFIPWYWLPSVFLERQSLALCLILRQLKHRCSFIHNSLSSVVRRSMSMVFGSRGEWMLQGVLVFLACGVNPLFWLEISWNLWYCASNWEVLSYHSLIVVGILLRVNILERIEVWIPSIKYSIKALSSLILDCPVRI